MLACLGPTSQLHQSLSTLFRASGCQRTQRRVGRLYDSTICVTPVAVVRTANKDFADSKHTTVKRKVALHFGYVGSGFRGSQLLRGSGNDCAVENVLEEAIAAAGGILPSNVGHTHKTGWSRSSRTDKGVHSLASVAALKIECEAGAFEEDPEGLLLATAINAHLPDQVRVFSAQRTHRAFNAREWCRDRTYQYHLPAFALGLSGGPEDAAVLQQLDNCLQLFQGNHAFHNFTERRRYRAKQRTKVKARAQELWQAHARSEHASQPQLHKLAGHRGFSSEPPGFSAETQDPFLDDNDIDVAAEVGGHQSKGGCSEGLLMSRLRPFKTWWVESNDTDLITQSHYRKVLSASASGPAPLLPGGQPCITICLQGASFMVYQIRHMIGLAVSVASGLLPLDFVPACFSQHVRATLPLAPPSTLALAGSSFNAFPRTGGEPHPVCRLSGERLALRSGGQAARDTFRTEVLNPALEELLHAPSWRSWRTEMETALQNSEAEVQNVLANFNHWTANRAERRAARQQQQTAVLGLPASQHCNKPKEAVMPSGGCPDE